MTHYEVLGVARDASPEQVRDAFRRLARAHHPDTSASGSAESLTPINEAWRVLGDPELRRAYDRQLDAGERPGVVDSSPSAPSSVPEPLPPSSFPWRFVAGLAAVGVGIVVLGVATYQPPKPGPPDNVLEQGSCVVIHDNGDASEVNCDADHDGVVGNILGSGESCPISLEPHRDQQGLGVVCVQFDF
jgi:hypothetical protein